MLHVKAVLPTFRLGHTRRRPIAKSNTQKPPRRGDAHIVIGFVKKHSRCTPRWWRSRLRFSGLYLGRAKKGVNELLLAAGFTRPRLIEGQGGGFCLLATKPE
jgi:hypothetical protein